MNYTHPAEGRQRHARLLASGQCLACGSDWPGPTAKPLLFEDWPPGCAAWMCRPCWLAGPPAVDTDAAAQYRRRLAAATAAASRRMGGVE